MVAATQRLIAGWRDGETRNIHGEMVRLTLEIAAHCLFSVDVRGEAAELGVALDLFLEETGSPGSLLWELSNWLPTPSNLRARRAIARLDRIVCGLIRRRRRNGPGGDDVLSLLMRDMGAAPGALTARQLRDEVMTLLLAGHETTAACLSWTFYLLARHPQAEAALVTELDAVLGARAPTHGDLEKLRYASMVVRESLRLYPPGFGIGRQARHDCELIGYHVPAGTVLGMYQWVMHRDARYFSAPENFEPRRWEDDLEARLSPGVYFPFGAGPRGCIGHALATTEAVLVLSTIAQRFRLALAPGQVVTPWPCITMRPKQGINVVLARRQPKPASTPAPPRGTGG
jgi:cytochrome P450